MLLFINACARKRGVSRTLELCDCFIKKYRELNSNDELIELDLFKENISCISAEEMQKRESLMSAGRFEDEEFKYAEQFANANKIVIGAPYWDLSFPAVLKAYIERVCVTGLTFKYVDDGPIGLCRSEKMLLISTAGGCVGENNYGGRYLRAICGFLGAGEFSEFYAEGLDIVGNDPKAIVESAKERIISLAQQF